MSRTFFFLQKQAENMENLCSKNEPNVEDSSHFTFGNTAIQYFRSLWEFKVSVKIKKKISHEE